MVQGVAYEYYAEQVCGWLSCQGVCEEGAFLPVVRLLAQCWLLACSHST